MPKPKTSTMTATRTRAAGIQTRNGSRFPDPGESCRGLA